MKCENIDGQCGSSWCDCDYQKRKRANGLSSAAGSLLAECLEILEDVLHETVDASSYPDGQNLDSQIRRRIKKALRQAKNIELDGESASSSQ